MERTLEERTQARLTELRQIERETLLQLAACRAAIAELEALLHPETTAAPTAATEESGQ